MRVAPPIFPATRGIVLGLTGALIGNLKQAYNLPSGHFAGGTLVARRNAVLDYFTESYNNGTKMFAKLQFELLNDSNGCALVTPSAPMTIYHDRVPAVSVGANVLGHPPKLPE